MEYSNKDLLKFFQSPKEEENETAIRYLYDTLFDKVLNFVRRNNGNEQDAYDVFQEGLFGLLKLARTQKLSGEINIEPYLFSCCKYIWWRELGSYKKMEAFRKTLKIEYLSSSRLVWEEKKIELEELKDRLNTVTQFLGSECYEILRLFYYNKWSMRSIAERLGYSGEQVAKNKKSSCMKKLRALIANSKDNLGLK